MSIKYKVNANTIVRYHQGSKNVSNIQDIENGELRETAQEKRERNLLQNNDKGYNGVIGKRAKANIRELVQNWVIAGTSPVIRKHLPNPKKKKFSFVTVTLPAKQNMTDQEIRRTALNGFIQEMKRKSNLNSYIWVAEKQKNGNIHFHIIIDTYVPAWKLRNMWRKQMYLCGLVSEYTQEGYGAAALCTKIDELKTPQKAAKYISKYMAKCDTAGINGYPLAGRIWGKSDNIEQYRGITINNIEAKCLGIDEYLKGLTNYYIVNEYVTVYNYSIDDCKFSPIIDYLIELESRQ